MICCMGYVRICSYFNHLTQDFVHQLYYNRFGADPGKGLLIKFQTTEPHKHQTFSDSTKVETDNSNTTTHKRFISYAIYV